MTEPISVSISIKQFGAETSTLTSKDGMAGFRQLIQEVNSQLTALIEAASNDNTGVEEVGDDDDDDEDEEPEPTNGTQHKSKKIKTS